MVKKKRTSASPYMRTDVLVVLLFAAYEMTAVYFVDRFRNGSSCFQSISDIRP